MKRRVELDLCRICACIMVLVIHSCSEAYHSCPIGSEAFRSFSFISTSARPSVPLFFMLSGALLLSRESLPLKPFFRKHVLRLVLLYIFWSFFYALGARLASGDFDGIYQFSLSIIAGHYHMWFLSAMTVCSLFVPVLHAALHGGGLDRRWLMGILLFTVLLMANFNLTPEENLFLFGITKNFSLDWLRYLLYIVLGYMLGMREYGKKTLILTPAIFLICAIMTTEANLWYSSYRGYADGWLFSYFSLPNFIMSSAILCFFLALSKIELRGDGLIRELSDCTLGVYLIHPLVINLLERFGFVLGTQTPYISTAGYVAVLSLVCFISVFIGRKLPIIRKLL